MIYKSAAGMFLLAAFLFAPATFAQEEEVIGRFYENCGPTDGPATTIELAASNLRITVYEGKLQPDMGYRTKGQVFEGEEASMEVGICEADMKNCKPIEGVLSTHSVDADTIEATIEYFDGTETQGDSESVQGPMRTFKALRDKELPPITCG